MKNLLKILATYATLEAAAFLCFYLWRRVPVNELWFPYLLYFFPPLGAMPLILWALRARNRPKVFAVRFSIAMAMFFFLIAIAMYFSGILSAAGAVGISYYVFATIFCLVVAIVQGYRIAYKAANSKPG
jgi:hypothetical protein